MLSKLAFQISMINMFSLQHNLIQVNLDRIDSAYRDMTSEGRLLERFEYTYFMREYRKIFAFHRVEAVFKKLINSGFSPHATDFNIMIEIFGIQKRKCKIDRMRSEMDKIGLDPTQRTYEMLISAYNNVDYYQSMCSVLEEMKKRKFDKSVFIYCKLANVCQKKSDLDGIYALKNEMVGMGMHPSRHFYTPLLQCLAKTGKHGLMFDVLTEMKASGVLPNVVTYGCMINAFARLGDISKVNEIFGIMKLENIEPNVICYGPIFTLYIRTNNMVELRKVMETMRTALPDTRNSFDKQVDYSGLANDLISLMATHDSLLKSKIPATFRTFTAIIRLLGSWREFDLLSQCVREMDEGGLVLSETFLCEIVYMYETASTYNAELEGYKERVRDMRRSTSMTPILFKI